MLNSRCWILDAGYSMLDTRCWILDAGYSMDDRNTKPVTLEGGRVKSEKRNLNSEHISQP
jgi:hypothetical protein